MQESTSTMNAAQPSKNHPHRKDEPSKLKLIETAQPSEPSTDSVPTIPSTKKSSRSLSLAKRIYLKFEREEDLALYARLTRDAEKQRYDVQTYILLVLLQAYPEPDITEERKRELLTLAN